MVFYESHTSPEIGKQLKAGFDLAKTALHMDGIPRKARLKTVDDFTYTRVRMGWEDLADKSKPPLTNELRIGAKTLSHCLYLNTETSMQGSKVTILASQQHESGNIVHSGPIILDRTRNPQNEQPVLSPDPNGRIAVHIETPLFIFPVTNPTVAVALAADALTDSVDVVRATAEAALPDAYTEHVTDTV